MVQHPVGHPAQLEPEVPVVALGADDQEVGVTRGSHQDVPGVALDPTAVGFDIGGDVVQRLFQYLDRLLLMHPRGSPDEQGWSVVSCAGHRQARTASRTAPRSRASSQAKRTAAGVVGLSPTPTTMRPCVPGRTWLSWLPRTTTIGQCACPATLRLTEPSSASAMPLRPRVPVTSREAWRLSRTSVYSGSSGSVSVEIFRSA